MPSRTGKAFYEEERIQALGDYYASAVAADGKIYFVSERGVTVIEASGKLQILARNDLKDQVMATPAIIGPNLYVRTAKELLSFQNPAEATIQR